MTDISITVHQDSIPKGADLIEAYETASEIAVIGTPLPEHNCDVMGCGSMCHVKYRFKKNKRSTQLGIQMIPIPIPAGSYDVWSGDNRRKIQLKRFAVSSTPITQRQFESVMGYNPSVFQDGTKTENQPVERMSVYGAIAFCNALSLAEVLPPFYKLVGNPHAPADLWASKSCSPGYYSYRLPSADEWEAAARAGSKNDRYNDPDGCEYPIDEIAWYRRNTPSLSPQPVARKKPNAWGLYDTLGNVFELAQLACDVIIDTPSMEQLNLDEELWVLCGSCFFSRVEACTLSARTYISDHIMRFEDTEGFRICRYLPSEL